MLPSVIGGVGEWCCFTLLLSAVRGYILIHGLNIEVPLRRGVVVPAHWREAPVQVIDPAIGLKSKPGHWIHADTGQVIDDVIEWRPMEGLGEVTP
jgi:hypothetical protein